MEFQIIDSKKLMVSNGSEVRLYETSGQRINDGVPSLKMFGETASIWPPTLLIGDTFESVVAEYMDNRRAR